LPTVDHDVLLYSGDEEYVAGIREFAVRASPRAARC
jgi:hypothetical protein